MSVSRPITGRSRKCSASGTTWLGRFKSRASEKRRITGKKEKVGNLKRRWVTPWCLNSSRKMFINWILSFRGGWRRFETHFWKRFFGSMKMFFPVWKSKITKVGFYNLDYFGLIFYSKLSRFFCKIIIAIFLKNIYFFRSKKINILLAYFL